MKAWIWLRVAAVLDGLFTAGHTLGHFSSGDSGPDEKAVTDAMKNFHFEIMGSTRTIWGFFRGFSLFLSLSLLILTVVVWLLASVARSSPPQARPMTWALLVGHVMIAALCWSEFFLAPSLLSTLAAAALLVAAIGLQSASRSLSA